MMKPMLCHEHWIYLIKDDPYDGDILILLFFNLKIVISCTRITIQLFVTIFIIHLVILYITYKLIMFLY